MWFGERLNRRWKTRNPKFALCCMQGEVQLPLLKEPPEVLKNLLNGDDKLSKHFQRTQGLITWCSHSLHLVERLIDLFEREKVQTCWCSKVRITI